MFVTKATILNQGHVLSKDWDWTLSMSIEDKSAEAGWSSVLSTSCRSPSSSVHRKLFVWRVERSGAQLTVLTTLTKPNSALPGTAGHTCRE